MVIPAVANCRRRMPPWARATAGLCLSCLAIAPASMPAGQKAQPPSPTAQQRAIKLAREVYRNELAAAKTPDQKAELAQKMMDAAAEEKKDPTGQFALLVLARETAVDAGAVEAAFAATDEVGSAYQVDILKLKHEAALAAVKSLRAAEQRERFCEAVDPLIAALAQEDRYEPARQLAESALAVARLSDDRKLVRQAIARLQEVREEQTAFGEARVAQAALKRKPDDADAALRLGRFRCLFKGDWNSGLPMLAKGSDPALRKLAEQDLARPSTPESRVALGDAWWDLSERVSGTAKVRLRQRASSWYTQALSNLDKGLLRQKVEQRLNEVAAVATAEKPRNVPAQGFRWSDLPRYQNLRLVPSWENLRPRKTLQAQTVKGTMTLSKADSPYLVIGFLAVDLDATLTIDPGVIILFAPGAQVAGKGTISMNSETDWIVLAAATPGQTWKGISSGGRVSARRCLIVGADSGITVDHDDKGGLEADQCVFAGNHAAVLSGEHGSAKLRNCLLFRNEIALGSEADGAVMFSKCLLAVNAKGYAAKYSGKCSGTDSTFLANGVALESGIYGQATEVYGCNILASTKLQANTRGTTASMNLRHNFWGRDVARAIAAGQARTIQGKVDAIEWLEQPAADALPSLPRCEYLAY